MAQWLSASGALAVTDPGTASRRFELHHDDQRRLARGPVRREHPAHTLSATTLARQAWFRMAQQTRTQWKNRSHFLAVSSTMMRRIPVNRRLARHAAKRDVERVA